MDRSGGRPGYRRLSDEEIFKSIETRAGQVFDETRVKADLQRLYDLGQFDVSQTKVRSLVGRADGVVVIFEVRELQLIDTVEFEGLKHVTVDELKSHLKAQNADVLPNTPYDLLRMRKTLRVLSDYLKSRGYANAKGNLWEEEKSSASIAIKFVIDEIPEP